MQEQCSVVKYDGFYSKSGQLSGPTALAELVTALMERIGC